MSLLEELAKNSCVVDFSIDELVPSLSVDLPLSETSQPSQTKSNRSSYQLIATNVVSPDRKRYISVGSVFDNSDWGSQSRYLQHYRDKFTKIDGMVSLLSTKTRKMKYQFMVHLERWCKQLPKQKKQHQNSDKNEEIGKTKKVKTQSGDLIFYSNLQQMMQTIQTKRKQLLLHSFGRLHKKLRCWMKIDFFVKVVEGLNNTFEVMKKRLSFHQIKRLSQKHKEKKQNINVSKGIKFPFIKKAEIKTQIQSEPINQTFSKDTNLLKQLIIYPQQKLQENIDYCDTMNLFMTVEEKGQEKQILKGEGSFIINSNCSALSSKKSQSPKSYVKMLSEIQFTAVPCSAFDKRKVSDLISSVDEGIPSDYSHHNRRSFDTEMSPVKSEVVYEKTVMKLEDELAKHEEKYNMMRERDNHERRASSPEEIMRSRSEIKLYQSQREKLIKQDIESNYKEEMSKYLRFKKSLQERRTSTLKEIQKSQQTIQKLMIKYRKQKIKNHKLKVTIKLDRLREESIKVSQKNVENSSRRQSHSRQKTKKDEKNNNFRNEENTISNSFAVKSKKQMFKNDLGKEKIDILAHYMKEKNKMKSQKVTPKKKNSRGSITEQSSAKKSQKKNIPSSAHKNLYDLSEFPLQKEQRIDLKVNILKQTPKKISQGKTKKPQGKNETKQKQKNKPKVLRK